ncbi:MAG: hypothetical protein C4527_27665 [Candidatus Omnitrophota bacterium]|jgi:hypothetical protein|nr:MAG: hypothetical protein C4527_27665 [Candidatus Omnitrophota bacterium]
MKRINERMNTQCDFRSSHEIETRYAAHLLFFTVGWWFCFILYPLWYVPQPVESRSTIFFVVVIVWIVCTYLFRFLMRCSQVLDSAQDPFPADRRFFGLLFSVAFVLHLPFLNKPILAGLDTIDHAAIPAVVAHRFVYWISKTVGFSIQPVLMVLFWIAILGIVLIPSWRARLVDGGNKLSLWFVRHVKLIFVFLILLSSFYCIVLMEFAVPERFGDLSPISRYPPASKIILIPLYMILGLQEWILRVLQILMTFAGAFYLYHLIYLFAARTAARIGAIMFVFLPPIFHYGNTNMIDCGTLFFVAASFYHWVRYVEKKTADDLIMGMLFCTFGGLYKHPLVSVIPAFTLMVMIDFIFPKVGQRRYWLQPALACAIPTTAILLYMKLSAFNTDVPNELGPLTMERLLANLQAIPLGVTWPVAIAFALGFVYLAAWRYRRLFILLVCWIGVHYLLTCISMVYENVRQALPYYVGLMIGAAILLADIAPKRNEVRAMLIYLVLPAYLIWACLFMDRAQDHRVVGRPMGDRSYVNFSNWRDAYIPYDAAMKDLQTRTSPGDVIYAPMTNEPSHFYLAKYNLMDRTYIRKIWLPPLEETLENLNDFCRENECDWLMVVRGKWLYSYADVELLEQLFVSPPESFEPATVYACGNVQLGLWRIR